MQSLLRRADVGNAAEAQTRCGCVSFASQRDEAARRDEGGGERKTEW